MSYFDYIFEVTASLTCQSPFYFDIKSLLIYTNTMSKSCLIAIAAVIMILMLIGYFILSIFVVSNAYCEEGNYIPNDLPVQISINDWIQKSMIINLVVFCILSGFLKIKSNNSCVIGTLVLLLVLYTIFILVWSIIGLVIEGNYYQEVCGDT